jgi:hypothetical protein
VNFKQKSSLGAAALSMTSIALAAGVPSSSTVAAAGTTPPPVNASDYTLSCGTVSGKVGFSPGLTDKPSGMLTEKWKIKATNCTATPPPSGGPPVNITMVAMSGVVTLPNGDSCPGFADGSMIGGLTEKWKTAHGSAKLSNPSLAQINWGDWSWGCTSTGTASVTLPAIQAGVQFPAPQVSGPFAGTDGGASSKLVLNGGTFSSRKLSSPGGVRSVIYQEMPGDSLFLG